PPQSRPPATAQLEARVRAALLYRATPARGTRLLPNYVLSLLTIHDRISSTHRAGSNSTIFQGVNLSRRVSYHSLRQPNRAQYSPPLHVPDKNRNVLSLSVDGEPSVSWETRKPIPARIILSSQHQALPPRPSSCRSTAHPHAGSRSSRARR